jgi:hypothetical protein
MVIAAAAVAVASPALAQGPDPNLARNLAATCANCHGTDGVSAGGTESLAGQSKEALADERLDFFAAGHPLVEGLLAHLEESPLGRAAVLRVTLGAEKGLGLLALDQDGPAFEALAVDASGRRRPDWAAALRRRPLRTRRLPPELAFDAGWSQAVGRLARGLDPARRPVALAALVLGP